MSNWFSYPSHEAYNMKYNVHFTLFFAGFILIFNMALCNQSTKIEEQKEQKPGFISENEDRYFKCIRLVDRLINKYGGTGYYKVDEQKRQIVITKPLSPREKKELVQANKELTDVMALYSKCSPGDYAYLKVKDVLYPLLREMSHRLHTNVLQPLGIDMLDMYDHARKILTPIILVIVVACVIKILQKKECFPKCSSKKLILYSAIVAVVGILYNYRHEIAERGKEIELLRKIDFASLARTQDGDNNK